MLIGPFCLVLSRGQLTIRQKSNVFPPFWNKVYGKKTGWVQISSIMSVFYSRIIRSWLKFAVVKLSDGQETTQGQYLILYVKLIGWLLSLLVS